MDRIDDILDNHMETLQQTPREHQGQVQDHRIHQGTFRQPMLERIRQEERLGCAGTATTRTQCTRIHRTDSETSALGICGI